jgi:fatty acid desaturase
MESADAGGTSQEPETQLREQAIERIQRKRKFRRDVVIYVLVNAGLWVIWAIDGAKTDDVWPAWVSGIWGALLVLDAFKTYGEAPISDQQIEKEMGRIRRR